MARNARPGIQESALIEHLGNEVRTRVWFVGCNYSTRGVGKIAQAKPGPQSRIEIEEKEC